MYYKKSAIVIIFILLCLISTQSYAVEQDLNRVFQNNIANIGKKITIEKENIGKNLYSVEKDKNASSGTYNIMGYVKITGSKAESITGTKKISKLNTYNSALAYLLKNTQEKETQNIIWNWMDNWQTSVGNELGYTWKINTQKSTLTESQKEYIELARKYANTTPNIKIKGELNIKISNNISGPYKVKYIGKIDKVFAINEKGEDISSKIEIYTDTKLQNKIEQSQIKSGKSFYIKNNSGQTISTIKVQLEKSKIINAEIWFMNSLKNNNAQKLMYVKTYQTEETPSVTIKLTNQEPMNQTNISTTQIVPAQSTNLKSQQEINNLFKIQINKNNIYQYLIIILLLNIVGIQIIMCKNNKKLLQEIEATQNEKYNKNKKGLIKC